MIKTDRQYRITKAQAAKLEQAFSREAKRGESAKAHPALRKAHSDALSSQLADLLSEIKHYEALRAAPIDPD